MDTHEPSLRELASRVESTKTLLVEKVDSLRELQDQKWVAHNEVHRMGQKALDASLLALDVRLEAMNLFRSQILQERADFLKRNVYDVEHKALEDRMDAKFDKTITQLETSDKAIDTRLRDLERYRWVVTGVIVGLSVIINLIFKFWGK